MTNSAQAPFLTGVIEGFYGRQWSWDTRLAYADYLPAMGLNSYIYAPKGDPCLRRDWSSPWPTHESRQLQALSSRYRARGLQFGVGLSPFELYRSYGRAQRSQLQRKVEEIAGLGVSLLSILFDDMPGDLSCLAQRQGEIVADVCAWVPGLRVQVCPTYYSLDPVLEKYFGPMPEDYWPDLGRELPQGVDVYWTGNTVCAERISAADIAGIEGQLGRKVMLWDNYPVNDGAVRSKRLYFEPLANREEALEDLLTGHLCNPMNQGMLSLPALTGLAALYRTGGGPELVPGALGPATWELLQRHQADFLDLGLEGMPVETRQAIAAQFDRLPGGAALEVAAWLRGEYTFDPACLTD